MKYMIKFLKIDFLNNRIKDALFAFFITISDKTLNLNNKRIFFNFLKS